MFQDQQESLHGQSRPGGLSGGCEVMERGPGPAWGWGLEAQ